MITVISGTNRAGSNARLVADHYLAALQQRGLPTQLYSLENLPPDFLHTDLYGKRSAAFAPIEELMRATDLFLFIVPEYNGSFPGVLKLFIDSMDPKRIYNGKKAALVGVSTGRFGNVRGLEHLAGVLNYLQIEVMPFRAHLMLIQSKTDDSGKIINEQALAEINKQLDQLERFAGSLQSMAQKFA
jgi:NAD(P)H-dependent FMN reductase